MNLQDRIINLCINHDKLFAALIAKYRHFDDSIFKMEKYFPWCNELIGKYFNSMSLDSSNLKYYFENIPFNYFSEDCFHSSDFLKLAQFYNNPSLLRDADSFISWVSKSHVKEKINFQEICKNPFLTVEIIDKLNNFHNKLDWGIISESESLNWNYEFIEKYKERLLFRKLSLNKSLPWSIEFIEKYKNDWDWDWLKTNPSIPWSIELMEKYEDKLSFSHFQSNNDIQWSSDLIEKFEDRWNWRMLSESHSLPWSIELIEKFKDRWDWSSLEENQNIPWSLELIEKFENKFNFNGLSKNQSLPWSLSFIYHFKDKWIWFMLSYNTSLPWSNKLIEEFQDKWNWNFLSSNDSLPWSIELIDKYESKWNWQELIGNRRICWDRELILNYIDKIHWNGKVYIGKVGDYRYDAAPISANPNIKLDLDLLNRFCNSWEVGLVDIAWSELNAEDGEWMYYSNNHHLSIEIIDAYLDNFDWNILSRNIHLPWSIEFLEKHADRLNMLEVGLNDSCWDKIFSNIFDEGMIKEIYQRKNFYRKA